MLTDVIGQLAGDGPRLRLLDYESIKRFSRPDLVGVIRRLWSTHQDKAPARELLLRLIWLGGETRTTGGSNGSIARGLGTENTSFAIVWPMRMARIEHAWSTGFRRYIINASSAAGAEVRRVFEADFDQRGLRCLPPCRAADAGDAAEGLAAAKGF